MRLTVNFHHDGTFTPSPLQYVEGDVSTIRSIDFIGMTVIRLSKLLKGCCQYPVKGMYYHMPGKELSNGLKELKNDVDLADFIALGVKNDNVIDLYLEHHGYDLTHWVQTELGFDDSQEEDDVEMEDITEYGVTDYVGEDDVDIPYRTNKDPFLNKLCSGNFIRDHVENTAADFSECSDKEIDLDDENVDQQFKVTPGVIYPEFDPSLPWNEQKPTLGMRFEHPEQLKDCLANYGVANGFQLWYKRNDYRTLHVLCGRDLEEGRSGGKKGKKGDWEYKKAEGVKIRSPSKNVKIASPSKKGKGLKTDSPSKKSKGKGVKASKKKAKKGNTCTFKLWASWMQSESSFQIKTLFPHHTCSRNFDLGSLVTFKWIARQFAYKIAQDPTISYRNIRDQIKKKYLINVSVSQCKRAKQRALFDHEGGLIEHYSRLWDYRKQILDTNPGSTVHMDVEEKDGGKIHFKRFYVCFKAMKEGWSAGCRKVIGLDGCFLRGTCRGELLTAMGRDANNQMFPIAWAVINVENNDNWEWFLACLCEDLRLFQGAYMTIISDGHKVLLLTLFNLLAYLIFITYRLWCM